MTSETISDYRPNTPLKWLSIDIPSDYHFKPKQRFYEHASQPQKVRHIVGLEGQPICVVQTKDLANHNTDELLFPPNSYNERRIRDNYNQWHSPHSSNAGVLIKASRMGYDEVNALKYFTGLRNVSWNDRKKFHLDPLKKTDGWDKELDDIVKGAFQPIIQDNAVKAAFKSSLPPIKPPRSNQTSSSSSRSLYSSSGRLIPASSRRNNRSSKSSRTSRRSTARNSSTAVSSRISTAGRPLTDIEEGFEKDDPVKQQIFYILGGILQTQDPQIIKTWLLTATEREKALITDIVRSALLDREELNHFVNETEKEPECKLITTPGETAKSIRDVGTNTQKEGEIDRLVLDPIDFTPDNHPAINLKSPVLLEETKIKQNECPSRPNTTSSTFRPSSEDKENNENSDSNREQYTKGQWIPESSTAK